MEVRFGDDKLDRLEKDADYDAGLPRVAVRGFRKVMQLIRAATDERDLYGLKSLHFEKLAGKRSHQRSLRLNIQWRLIVEMVEAKPKNIVSIIGIEDYH